MNICITYSLSYCHTKNSKYFKPFAKVTSKGPQCDEIFKLDVFHLRTWNKALDMGDVMDKLEMCGRPQVTRRPEYWGHHWGQTRGQEEVEMFRKPQITRPPENWGHNWGQTGGQELEVEMFRKPQVTRRPEYWGHHWSQTRGQEEVEMFRRPQT